VLILHIYYKKLLHDIYLEILFYGIKDHLVVILHTLGSLINKHVCLFRGVIPGGAGGSMAPPDFGRAVNPISTREAGNAHQIILVSLDFQTFLRPCYSFQKKHHLTHSYLRAFYRHAAPKWSLIPW
jgi:hypothetical protein